MAYLAANVSIGHELTDRELDEVAGGNVEISVGPVKFTTYNGAAYIIVPGLGWVGTNGKEIAGGTYPHPK